MRTLIIAAALFASVEIIFNATPQKCRSYYADGSLAAEWTEDEQGLYHGQMIRYFPTGEVLLVVDFYHGQIGGGGHEFNLQGEVVRTW